MASPNQDRWLGGRRPEDWGDELELVVVVRLGTRHNKNIFCYG